MCRRGRVCVRTGEKCLFCRKVKGLEKCSNVEVMKVKRRVR